jgi:hypothetical protein
MTTAGAPIRTGEASPLRVATGGEASLDSEALAAARPPVRIHGAMDALGWPKSAALTVSQRDGRAPLRRSIGLPPRFAAHNPRKLSTPLQQRKS